MAQLAYGGECGHTEFIKTFEKWNDVEHRGYYFQPNHCFSVVIPKNVIGRSGSGPEPYHGIGAILSKNNGGAYLMVQGDWGSWLDDADDGQPSLENIVHFKLACLEEDKAIIIKQTVNPTHLAELPAKRLTVFYKCPHSQFTFILDSIFALASEGSEVYEITLLDTDRNYNRNKFLLEKIARSWKLEKAKCTKIINK